MIGAMELATLKGAIVSALDKGYFTGTYKIRVGRKYETVPLYTLRELGTVAYEIDHGRRHETVNEQVKRICEAHGIACVESGVGWTIG